MVTLSQLKNQFIIYAHRDLKALGYPKCNFPVKMTPIHKLLCWSLGGQGVVLTGVWMLRTPVSFV